MTDSNIRKLTIHQITYSKYCAKCNFHVKAEWAKNKGVEWGQLVIYCCVDGGQYSKEGKTVCPHGISFATKLGQEEPEFNIEDWSPERFKKEEKHGLKGVDSEEEDEDNILEEEDDEEMLEFEDVAVKKKKKGRRSNKGTFHGKSRGKHRQKEF